MSKLPKYAEHFMMAEFMKAKLEVFQNEMKRGVIQDDLK